jgi:hypothetical protein
MTRRLFGIAWLLLSLSGCTTMESQLKGIPYTAVAPYGELQQVMLDADGTVEGTMFPSGSKLSFDGGELRRVQLAGPATIAGVTYAAGSSLTLDAKMVIFALLGGSTTVGPNTFEEGDALTFAPSSTVLLAVRLGSARTFGGVQCEEFDFLTLGPTGQLLTRRTAAESKASDIAEARSKREDMQKRKAIDSCVSQRNCQQLPTTDSQWKCKQQARKECQ